MIIRSATRRNDGPRRWCAALVFFGVAATFTPPAGAEAERPTEGERETPKTPRWAALPPAWEPHPYAEGTLGLLEAVRITLANSPAIRLEEENIRFREGLFQEATGQFDASLIGDLNLEYLRQEVRASERQRQQESRDNLGIRVQEGQEQLDVTQQILDEVILAQNDPTGARIDGDPELQTQIDLLNLEIDRETDPANRKRLEDVRDQGLATARLSLEEDVADISMTLDEDSTDLANLGATPEEEESYTGLFNLQIVKPYRTGFQIAPFVEYSVIGDRFVNKPSDPDFGGKGLKDLYRVRIGFAVDMPLLRGFGRASTGAGERAAGIDFEASQENLEHVASENVLRTVQAYWELVAAEDRVRIFGDSLEIQKQVLELTEMMISADELPASELFRSQARTADALSALEAVRREALEARFALADSLGLVVEDEAAAPWPSDPFPPPPSLEVLETADRPALVRTALERRRDFSSSRRIQESGGVLLEAARRDLKSILDLGASFDYNSAEESNASRPLNGRYIGPSWSLDLAFEHPFANRTQKGRYVQALAESRRRDITAEDLSRSIRSNVVLLLGVLREARRQLATSIDAAQYAEASIRSETERFRLGDSTLIDVLLTEQRLTEARIQQSIAQQQIALLLAQLRFETGSFFEKDGEGEGWTIAEETFATLPQPLQPEAQQPGIQP